jgi:hypothetical protein
MGIPPWLVGVVRIGVFAGHFKNIRFQSLCSLFLRSDEMQEISSVTIAKVVYSYHFSQMGTSNN